MARDFVNGWDLAFFLGYEAAAMPVALAVQGAWQYAAMAIALTTANGARQLYKRRHPGSFARCPEDAPFWLQAVVGVPLAAGAVVLLGALGASYSFGWFVVAWGLYLGVQDPLDRAWTQRGRPRPA
jgi:hypothetical protein